MDIQARIGIVSSQTLCTKTLKPNSNSSSSFSFKFLCSSRRDSEENEPSDNTDNGDKTDWDRAWKVYKKRGNKKSFLSQFSPSKYVSWNPRRSEYPLSEEIDPIKRTERANLMLWTSPGFTLVGAIVLVTFLLIYTILAPVK